MTRSVTILTLFVLGPFLGVGVAQVPTDDPKEAQAKWYERDRERADLVPGAFEVLRFPTGYRFQSRYRKDPEKKKLILDPDFHCTRCLKEKRIRPPRPGQKVGLGRLMDREADSVLADLATITKSDSWVFLEDDTFQLFFDLPSVNLKLFANPFLKEELQELGDVFPEVTEKTVELDTHKRAHLYLIRAHRLLRDFWWLAGTTNGDLRNKYPHLGPFMGMNGKQQLFLFARGTHYEQASVRFIGRSSSDGQCWHFFNDRAMAMLMHAHGQEDPRTQNFFFHRLMHNLVDAFRMYSFKLPAWYQMGIGAWVERRETARFNCFCYSEGTIPTVLYETKWLPKVKKMVLADKVEPFAACCVRQEYAEFEPEYHMVAYSWFCFLLRLGPEKMPRFLGILKSKQPSETLYQIQVKAFREVYGLTLNQFDDAWRAWVRDVYPDL